MLGYGYLTGLEDVDQLQDLALLQREVLFATVLGGVFAIRWFGVTYLQSRSSALPTETPQWQRTAAKLVKHGMYISVLGIVLSGLAIAYSPYASLQSVFVFLHELILGVTPFLIGAHIMGVVFHMVKRDGVVRSMWR